MALTDTDRDLLRRCLENDTEAWRAFVDRFLGLVTHVVNHAAQCGGVNLSSTDREDLIAEVYLAFLESNKQVLRRFQGRSSLATYLSVIARRVVVKKLLSKLGEPPLAEISHDTTSNEAEPEQRIADQEHVHLMLDGLQETEAQAIRLFHLEGKSYQEISSAVGLPVNTIGPLLSRARTRLRDQAGV